MDFIDIINFVRNEAAAYTGSDALGFGYGTARELNERPGTQFPLVWVLTDPEFTDIQEAGNGYERYSFIFMTLGRVELDSQEPAVNELYAACKLVGDGIVHRLRSRDAYEGILGVEEVHKTLRLKMDDDCLTGLAYRLSVSLNNQQCNYPFA